MCVYIWAREVEGGGEKIAFYVAEHFSDLVAFNAFSLASTMYVLMYLKYDKKNNFLVSIEKYFFLLHIHINDDALDVLDVEVYAIKILWLL